jgi:hypothetical protein
VAAPSLRQLTSAYELRYSNTGHVPHRNFSEGMIRDIPSWESQEGACYDAADMLCDYVGKIRKRGGTTSPAAGNSAATVENLLSYRSNGVDGVTGLWGSSGKAGAVIYSINPATGAASAILSDGSATNVACRPFQHGNLMVFPHQALGTTTNDRNQLYFAGGGTGSPFVISAATVVANDNRVTAVVPTSFVAAHLGSIIELDNFGGTNTNYYAGRIVEITSSSSVRVEPVPNFGFTASSGSVNSVYNSAGFGAGNIFSGRYGVSFQNRIVLGYTLMAHGTLLSSLAKGLDVQPNRLIWTAGPTEAIPSLHGLQMDGQSVLFPGAFDGNSTTPLVNYLDIPPLGGMTGLAVVGEGQLLVFGPRTMYRISGQLTTESVPNNSFSFSDDQISSNVGIPAKTTQGIDDPSKSIQYAQGGVLFAGTNGIYLYDGASMKPLLQGRNARYYQDRLRAGDLIYGSAYSLPKNHYYLSMSGSDGGLMIDLDTNAMTRMTNMQFFDAVPDPSNATKLWGERWWDRTGAAPTMTKGQLIQIDPIWAPTSANKNDGDGTAVLPVFQSKSYMDGTLEANKTYNQLHIDYDLRGTGSPTATATADTELNTSDAVWNTLTNGTLANTGSTAGVAHIDPTNQLAPGKALEIKIALNAASDSFELLGFNIGFQQRMLS